MLMTKDFIEQLLSYNPQTGVFVRKGIWRRGKIHHAIGRAKAGDIAGSKCDRGYLWISLPGGRVSCHRLAWFLTHGEWATGDIDHINGNKSDNRLVNLRAATRSQNKQNIQKPMAHNSSGYLGVCFDKSRGKFVATINVNGKQKNLGRFDSAEEAHQRYLAAKRELHPFSTI